jgi:hypothetical protein
MKKNTEKFIVSLLGPKWKMRLVILAFLSVPAAWAVVRIIEGSRH